MTFSALSWILIISSNIMEMSSKVRKQKLKALLHAYHYCLVIKILRWLCNMMVISQSVWHFCRNARAGSPQLHTLMGGERQHSQCALPSSHLHGDTWAGSSQWHTVTRGGGHSQYALPSCTSSPGRCHLKAYLWASLCRTSRKNGQSQAGPSNERVFLWRRKKQTRGTCADTRVWRERCLFCSKEQAFWEHDYLLVLARNFNTSPWVRDSNARRHVCFRMY